VLFPEDPAFTVGERFKLICSPPSQGEAWSVDSELILNTEKPFLLRVLSRPRVEDQELVFELASYLVGHHEIQDLKIKSGGEIYLVSPWNLSVRSVQDPQSPAQEPLGPLGPSAMSFPWLSASILLIILGLIVILGFRALLRRIKNRSYLKGLEQKYSKTTPESLLYLELRKNFAVASLYPIVFELFALRLKVPFGLRPAKSVLKKIKPALPPQLANNILELERAFLNSKNLNSGKLTLGKLNSEELANKDVENLKSLVEQTVEKLSRWQKGQI
jgi:hypothetical protein